MRKIIFSAAALFAFSSTAYATSQLVETRIPGGKTVKLYRQIPASPSQAQVQRCHHEASKATACQARANIVEAVARR